MNLADKLKKSYEFLMSMTDTEVSIYNSNESGVLKNDEVYTKANNQIKRRIEERTLTEDEYNELLFPIFNNINHPFSEDLKLSYKELAKKYNLSEYRAIILKSALRYSEVLLNNSLSIKEKAKKLGKSVNTCSLYFYTLKKILGQEPKVKTQRKCTFSIDQLKTMNTKELQKKLNISFRIATNLHSALRHYEEISQSKTIEELIKNTGLSLPVARQYRSALTSLNLIEKINKTGKRKKSLIIENLEKKGISWRLAHLGTIALKKDNLEILLDYNLRDEEKAEKLGYTLGVIRDCKALLRRIGLLESKKEHFYSEILKEAEKQGINLSTLKKSQATKQLLEALKNYKLLNSRFPTEHIAKQLNLRKTNVQKQRKLLEEMGLSQPIPTIKELQEKYNLKRMYAIWLHYGLVRFDIFRLSLTDEEIKEKFNISLSYIRNARNVLAKCGFLIKEKIKNKNEKQRILFKEKLKESGRNQVQIAN